MRLVAEAGGERARARPDVGICYDDFRWRCFPPMMPPLKLVRVPSPAPKSFDNSLFRFGERLGDSSGVTQGSRQGRGSAQGRARKQARGIECRQRRARVVHDQRNLSATEYHGVARLAFHPPDDALEATDRLPLEDAIHQFIHDDAIDLFTFNGVRMHALQTARRELLWIDLALDEPARARQTEAPEAALDRLLGDDAGDRSQGSGDRGSTDGNAWWIVLSGQIRKSAPTAASLFADESISSPTPSQSPRSRHCAYSANECVCIETSGCACAPNSCAPSTQMVR